MRCNTPEFQQCLASIVAANTGSQGVDVVELKRVLSQQGGIMKAVFCEDPSKEAHQQLLQQVAEAEQRRLPLQQENQRCELVREHNQRKALLLAELQDKETHLKSALQESRRLMNVGSSGSGGPLRSLQQNIELIEKETELVSTSYEGRVHQLKKEIEMEDKRAAAEQQAQAEELLKFKQQAENDAKERKAIKTILDVKIMALVDNVARLCDQNALLSPAVNHDLSTLRKLVRASVEALE